MADYARLGAQRNAKIVGIFARLWKRDGKPRYLDLIPRVWEALERDLAHPALAPVARWFDANVPAAIREQPAAEGWACMTKLASDTAMVLAAGLGKRMRPLTASQPKPMVRVAGKPLIDHALDQLADAGVAKAVVNVHYLADALEAHLANAQGAASDHFGRARAAARNRRRHGQGDAAGLLPDPFFCRQRDNIWLDGPYDAFRELSEGWDPERMDALLLLVPHSRAHNYRGKGDFHLDALGRISRRRSGRIAPFIYTGIQLRFPPPAARCARRPVLHQHTVGPRDRGGAALRHLASPAQWFEVGDPAGDRPHRSRC